MRGQGMSLPGFVIIDGLLTVEAIMQPSWIVRRRVSAESPTSQYGWVCTMVQTAPEECTIKGYLAKDQYPMRLSERRAMERIGQELNFRVGRYERVDTSGNLRAAIEMWGKSA